MNERIDHENDVTCHAVPVVLFLFFRKKKININVKNKSTTILHGLHSMEHRNDAIKCSKLCSFRQGFIC